MNRQRKLISAALILFTASFVSAAHAAESKESRERSAAISAQIPLVDAIRTAEQRAPGKAVAAEIEYTKDKTLYEVTTISGGKRRMMTIDPETGNVIETNKKVSNARKHDDAVVAGALAEAVTNAENSAAGAKALEAEYVDMDDAGSRIRVRVVRSGNRVQDLDVDAKTGNVTKVGDIERR